MNGAGVVWSQIVNSRDLRCLQRFRCTADRPRSSSGRLLVHPRPWEWDVQSYLRNSPKLKAGHLVLVGRCGEDVVAVARLEVTARENDCDVFIASAAIGLDHRGKGGPMADALMLQIRETAVERCRGLGKQEVLLWGKIHSKNLPSQAMVKRAESEPLEAPSLKGLEIWGVRITVE